MSGPQLVWSRPRVRAGMPPVQTPAQVASPLPGPAPRPAQPGRKATYSEQEYAAIMLRGWTNGHAVGVKEEHVRAWRKGLLHGVSATLIIGAACGVLVAWRLGWLA